MRGHCTICTDYFGNEQDVSATLCGHVFHEKCLSQWFMESKPRRTCPQCRTKLKADQVIPKLFINLQECSDDDLDPYKLKEDLAECQLRESNLALEKRTLETSLKSLKKAHRELKDVNKTIRVDLNDWKQRHDGLLDSMKILQSMAQDAKETKKEKLSLQKRLKTCSNIELILDAGKADIADMLRRYSSPCDVKELASWCSSLKQEYETIKLSRDNVKLELMKTKKLANQQRRDMSAKLSEIDELKKLLDLQKRTEQQLIEENAGLRKKLTALQSAISSPSETRSSAISRLIAESPAPSNQDKSLHLTPDVAPPGNRVFNPNPSHERTSAKARKLTDRKENWPSSKLDFPIKVIDTTNSNIVKDYSVDSLMNPSLLSRPGFSRTQRNVMSKKTLIKAKTKPFSSKPVMPASLRPTLNLAKLHPR